MSEHPYVFSFSIDDLPPDTFVVHSFTGKEGLSELYRYDVLLVAQDNSISYEKILQKPCCLTMQGRTHTLTANGIVASLKLKQFESGKALYQALLVPQIHNLTLQQYSQIFLDKSFPGILKSILSDNEITDYELRLETQYPTLEYVCQFNETHFQFLSRWMEHYGIYFYFEQGENGEKIIFTDAAISHVAFADSDLEFNPTSGLDDIVRESAVHNFIAEYTSVPQNVLLKDYNYQYSTLKMQGQATVDANGVGTHYSYGDNFKSPGEAEPIAKIRAQEFQCRQLQMQGESFCLGMQSGFSFTLQKHFCQELNGNYLLASIQHTGRNWTAVTAPGANHQETRGKLVYSNTFSCIPMSQQFRPGRDTKKPRFYGLLSATIDAEGSGKYAELDSHGRYKVIMPFDLSGRSDGKASSWIRLAQPYAGGSYGMHFPLHKGTEVLISFVEGDVDRPLITGAVHNFDKPNHVATSNQDINSIITAGGHQFAIGDTAGNGFMHMQVSGKTAGLALLESGGSSGGNDDGDGDGDGDGGGESDEEKGNNGKFLVYNKEYYSGTFGQTTELKLGSSTDVTVGVSNELFGGGKGDINAGLSWGLSCGTVLEYFKGDKVGAGDHEFVCSDASHLLLGSSYSLLVGPPEPYSALISKLKTALALVAGASIATAATTIAAMASEYHLKEAPSNGYKSAASIISDVGSGADLVFDAAVMSAVHVSLSSIKGLMKAALVSSAIEVSKEEGIELIANFDIAPTAEIVLKNSSTVDPLNKATITLKEASTIILDAGGGDLNSISMKLGTIPLHPTFKMSTTEIVMKGGDGATGKFALGATDVTLSVGSDLTQTGVALTEDSVRLTSTSATNVYVKPAAFSVKTTDISLNGTASAKISTGIFELSATGTTTINGTVIKLG